MNAPALQKISILGSIICARALTKPPSATTHGATALAFGSIRSFIQGAPALLSQAASVQRDYHKVMAFTVLTAGAVRVGHSPVEDPGVWAEEVTGVKNGSGVMVAGMVAGHLAAAVIEAPVEAANLVRGAASKISRGVAGWGLGRSGRLIVYRGINEIDRAALAAGKGLAPAGSGGTIADQVAGRATKYISASVSPAVAAEYGSLGVVAIDVEKAVAGGAGYVEHENVVQATRRLGSALDVANAIRDAEVMFKRGIPASAILR